MATDQLVRFKLASADPGHYPALLLWTAAASATEAASASLAGGTSPGRFSQRRQPVGGAATGATTVGLRRNGLMRARTAERATCTGSVMGLVTVLATRTVRWTLRNSTG